MPVVHDNRTELAPQRFGTVAILLHWLIAAAILISLGLAWYLEDLDGEAKTAVLAVHKSVGIVIFMAAILRLGWRIGHPPPPYAFTMRRWQHLAASMTHVLLYVLLFSMPVTGYIADTARGRDTDFFGLFPVPAWVPLDRKLSYYALTAHDWAQYGLYALILLHVGAAFYHQIILKDGLVGRMWPRLGRQST